MTYEYICEACGHAWEAEQSISADPLRDCPSCKQPKAKRQISLGGGFILKGGGWYSDLYGSTNSASTSKSASSESTKSSTSSSSSSSDSSGSSESSSGGKSSGGKSSSDAA